MKYWSDFLSEVMPYVENCPNMVAENHIKNAAIEFCQRTALWRREFDAITVTANIFEYDYSTELTTDETISAIDYAFLTQTAGETPLYIATEDELKERVRNWRKITANEPSAIMMLDTENVRLYPIPENTIAAGLITGFILKPSRDAAGVPNWIHEQWAESIAHGAKSKILGMTSRPWHNPMEAAGEQESFDSTVKDATMRVNKGHSRRNTKIQMRPIA